MKYSILLLLGVLCMTGLKAQTSQKSNPGFEVSASLYPWDVHDEGIELMLDNLTSMAGVNSVYLIAIMHEEHRPFLGPRGTGPWLYIHNPARTEWYAEDSRAYFFPQMDMYGKIKPFRSDNSWLSDTDYLKLVINAARARGLKVGVEVSHTYLPKSIYKTHPEYQQIDINNKPIGPMGTPCPNNPDTGTSSASLRLQRIMTLILFKPACYYSLMVTTETVFVFANHARRRQKQWDLIWQQQFLY
jgi:hypothetical protein